MRKSAEPPRCIRPKSEDFHLYLTIIRPNEPVRNAACDGVLHRFESRDCSCNRSRSEGWTETLVGPLMSVRGRDDWGVKRVRRLDFGPPIISKCRVDRQTPLYNLGQQSVEPTLRDKIEQRGRGDQVYRTNKRGVETGVKVQCTQLDRKGRRNRCHCTSESEQVGVVVDKTPHLAASKMRSQRTKHRPDTACEINHSYEWIICDQSSGSTENRRITCACVVGFTQCQPVG